jgi:hypothetical protein
MHRASAKLLRGYLIDVKVCALPWLRLDTLVKRPVGSPWIEQIANLGQSRHNGGLNRVG